MPLHVEKTVYDPAAPETDGLRILATRFWPRGVKREAADLYLPDLAPSRELLAAFKAGEIDWRGFSRRYRKEMKGQTSLLRMLAWLDARGEAVTLMCACENTQHCHRFLLPDLVAKSR